MLRPVRKFARAGSCLDKLRLMFGTWPGNMAGLRRYSLITRKQKTTSIKGYQYIRLRWRMAAARRPLRWRQWQDVRATAVGSAGRWEVFFALLDLIGVLVWYEIITNGCVPGVRPLRPAERHFLAPIFGDSISWELVRIDERAWLGPRQQGFCYVSGFTINTWGPISPSVLVHEMVHVWQYEQVGAAYIPRALRAQYSEMGYDYGGLVPLQEHDSLAAFNYEQQADIIEDAFRLTQGLPAQWHGYGPEVLPAYYPYLREVNRSPACP